MAKKNSGIFIEWGKLDPYLFGLRIEFSFISTDSVWKRLIRSD